MSTKTINTVVLTPAATLAGPTNLTHRSVGELRGTAYPVGPDFCGMPSVGTGRIRPVGVDAVFAGRVSVADADAEQEPPREGRRR